MTASEILSKLERQGIELQAHGDRLRFRPKDAVTPDLRVTLAEHKREILEALQSKQPATDCGLCPEPDRCQGCYSIGVIDGRKRFLHPPRVSREWRAWLERWQPGHGGCNDGATEHPDGNPEAGRLGE